MIGKLFGNDKSSASERPSGSPGSDENVDEPRISTAASKMLGKALDIMFSAATGGSEDDFIDRLRRNADKGKHDKNRALLLSKTGACLEGGLVHEAIRVMLSAEDLYSAERWFQSELARLYLATLDLVGDAVPLVDQLATDQAEAEFRALQPCLHGQGSHDHVQRLTLFLEQFPDAAYPFIHQRLGLALVGVDNGRAKQHLLACLENHPDEADLHRALLQIHELEADRVGVEVQRDILVVLDDGA